MLQRTSVVDHARVKIVSYSSIFQIGDSHSIYSLSRALAVQREAEIDFGVEGNFAAYHVFTDPIPILPIEEQFSMVRHNVNPIIKVKRINITGISSASLLHIGSSCHVSMEARIKHIRQLLPVGHEQDIS